MSIDSRGYGQSEGLFATFGGREADDIRVWIDILSRRISQIDSALCFQPALWGRSMGAAIALRAAALDHRVVAMVLESPMVDIERSTAVILRRRRIPLPNLLARLVIRRAGKLAGIPIRRPTPTESASKARRRVTIVHVSEDNLVPISEARRVADSFLLAAPLALDVPERSTRTWSKREPTRCSGRSCYSSIRQPPAPRPDRSTARPTRDAALIWSRPAKFDRIIPPPTRWSAGRSRPDRPCRRRRGLDHRPKTRNVRWSVRKHRMLARPKVEKAKAAYQICKDRLTKSLETLGQYFEKDDTGSGAVSAACEDVVK